MFMLGHRLPVSFVIMCFYGKSSLPITEGGGGGGGGGVGGGGCQGGHSSGQV